MRQRQGRISRAPQRNTTRSGIRTVAQWRSRTSRSPPSSTGTRRTPRALSECLDEWDFSENLHNLGHLLVVAAGIAQASGEAALGVRLLGSVAALFERLGIALQFFEAQIDRETRKLAEADLGTARYEEELERGAAIEPAAELALVKESLRRWATAGQPKA